MRTLLVLSVFPLLLAAQQPFSEVAQQAGITGVQRARGVSVCDYNGDSAPDVFISVLDGPNRLYRNDGHGSFTEVDRQGPLATAGNSMLSLWADLDNDGLPEVFIGNKSNPSRLFGQRAGTFVDITAGSGIELSAQVQAGSILDYDGDGLLDLYLSCLNAPNRLYHNLGNLQFEEVGGAAGAAREGLGMGTLALDYDQDGDPDLYLVHDGNQPNVLLQNQGDGTFTDVSTASGTDVVGDGMGVDAADYDGDGDFDLYVTNLYENFLLQNQGDGTFREVGFDSRTNDLGMGWGIAWLDYDLDGYPDLYVANETNFAVGGQRYHNILYHNDGSGAFSAATTPDAAICSPLSGYGAATADFDGDGRPDLFVANSGQASELFRNATSTDHHWIKLRLTGTTGNRDAIGAHVSVWTGEDRRQIAEVRTGGSFASQHDRTLLLGLGTAARVDSVVVRWPGGAVDSYPALAADVLYDLTEGAAAEVVATTGTTATRQPMVHPLKVYPNPTNGGNINLSRALGDVRLYDAYGRLLFRQVGPVTTVSLPPLPAATYHLTGLAEDDRLYRAVLLLREFDPSR